MCDEAVVLPEENTKMLRFRLNGGWDYVWVTYHDVLGLITITSSFGNFSYIWASMGEGVRLRQFFIRAEPDYLVNKFFMGRTSNDRDEFQLSRAVNEIKKDIFRERRSGVLRKAEARSLFDAIDEIESELETEVSADLFSRAFLEDKALMEWQPNFYENSYGVAPSPQFLALRDQIIPMIQEEFAHQLLVK
jgi:hypothetical protein